ncbi:MAG: hypothetical protein ABIJ96_08965 [Elusimicrobiota bacterium]
MQHELITFEGAKPKKRLSLASAYIVCTLAALLPGRLRIAFIFAVNFVYNHIFATTRLIVAFLCRQLTHLLILLAYYLVLGPTALLARLLRRDYLLTRRRQDSMYTDKEPADSGEERFLRQY